MEFQRINNYNKIKQNNENINQNSNHKNIYNKNFGIISLNKNFKINNIIFLIYFFIIFFNYTNQKKLRKLNMISKIYL